ncbi:hypothetical protein AGDE_14004 [Angomonas deanei]|nr:hypothetical protein AGDE_14004 [Angomonas deanei]|eukprot:EPY21537.1 hypothetical protein AGDE_14004 [Angomonas deanei]
MMKEIHSIQRTLSVVQQSAIDTVDVLQQVQMEVLPISTLQETLLRLSKGLLVLAEKNGLDEDLFRVEEEQLLLADK